jgi:hypothetical protein
VQGTGGRERIDGPQATGGRVGTGGTAGGTTGGGARGGTVGSGGTTGSGRGGTTGSGGSTGSGGGRGGTTGSGGSTPGIDGGPTTGNLCEGLVQDKDKHPMTAVPKPAVGAFATDNEFKTKIYRVSEVKASGSSDAVVKPMYSTISAWNADESMLLLYNVTSGHQLYDGKTYVRHTPCPARRARASPSAATGATAPPSTPT